MICIPIIISVFALIVSYLAFRRSKQLRTSLIFTELAQQANIINEAIARYKIRGPYAVLLKVQSEDIERFGGLGAVFFHHINLLQIVYRNREYLGKDVETTYKDWVSNILKPWLESDQNLVEMWCSTRENRDLLGKDFIEWLEPLLPIHGKMAKGNSNPDGV